MAIQSDSGYITQVANTADQRTLGFFQLSVGSSLAIESMVSIHPDLPKPAIMPVREYREVWVNVRTLFRNMMNAMPSLIAEQITPLDVAQVLIEEMAIIPDMLHEYAGYAVKVTYYFNNLKRIEVKYPEAEIRHDTTPKQLRFASLLGDVMKIVLKHQQDTILIVDDTLPGTAVKTVIMTHMPYDLLSEKHFGGLTLLESHTGKLKGKSLWYTKFYEGKALAHIPFTEEMLQVFGDTELFRPLDHRLRKALLEIAEKRNWSFATTRARIIDGVNELQNPAYVLKLKKIYNVLI